MRGEAKNGILIIKPIGWRQACFSLFLLIISAFFAIISRYGLLVSWLGTISMLLLSLLSVLDQVLEWSRLKVDSRGFWLRGWFRNQRFEHHEIEDFKIHEFTGKKLLTVVLKEHARRSRKLPDQPIPFPCCFGRPIEEVLKVVKSKIDRTPRPLLPKT